MSRWLIVMLATAVLGTGLSLYTWSNRETRLPIDPVPTHWGMSGEPDRFTAREDMFWSLMLVPLMMFGFVALATVIPWLSPRNFSIEPFRATYWYIMALVGLMFLTMHVIVLAAYAGLVADVGRWIVGGMLPFMALMGNVLGKVRKNFWVGIRTPWTLASDLVWTRTHRLGAWLFVGGSLLGLALLLIGVNPLIALTPFLMAALVPVFYSLWLYRRLEREGRLEQSQPPASN